MPRLHELDALRSFCMIYGVFFHAHSVAPFWFSWAILEASGFFRMATFFFVSAFFTVMLIERRGLAPTLRSRAVALGVPLLAAFLTLVPIAKWAQFSLALLPGEAAGFWDVAWRTVTYQITGAYLHLWFLIVLLVYLATAPILLRILRLPAAGRLVGRAVRPVPRAAQIPLLALLTGGAAALSMTLGGMILSERALRSVLVGGCFFHFPFYVLGIAFYVFRDRFSSLIRFDAPALALGTAAATARLVLPDLEPGPLYWVLNGTASTVFLLALTALFTRLFHRTGPRLAYLSRSVYSVYLVHFTFIYLAGYGFARLGVEGAALYLLVVATALPASFLFHDLVERVPALQFLYNGRVRPRPARLGAGGLARPAEAQTVRGVH